MRTVFSPKWRTNFRSCWTSVAKLFWAVFTSIQFNSIFQIKFKILLHMLQCMWTRFRYINTRNRWCRCNAFMYLHHQNKHIFWRSFFRNKAQKMKKWPSEQKKIFLIISHFHKASMILKEKQKTELPRSKRPFFKPLNILLQSSNVPKNYVPLFFFNRDRLSQKDFISTCTYTP